MRQFIAHLASAKWLIACGVVGVVAVLWFMGHRAHILGAVPYLLVLACPLMHLFMHHGHGHNHTPAESETPAKTPEHHEGGHR